MQPDGTDFGGVNPFGVIPFVEFRDYVPVDQYHSLGAFTLAQANQQININMMNLNMAIQFQSFDQPYATGITEEDAARLKVGPNQWLATNKEGANYGLIGYNPKIMEIIEAVKSQVQLIAYTYNLAINWAIEGNPASGFSLIVQNIDLLEARHDDVEVAEVQEKELYKVLSTMQNWYIDNGHIQGEEKLPLDAMPMVDFQEIDFPINQKEELDRWDWEFKHNISTPIDYIQSKNTDMDDEQAMTKYQDNKKILGKMTFKDRLKESLEAEGGAILPGGDLE